jgi:hypothetical protein
MEATPATVGRLSRDYHGRVMNISIVIMIHIGWLRSMAVVHFGGLSLE